MKIRHLAQRIGLHVREHGWRVTLKKGVGYLWGLVYLSRIYRIYRINLETVSSRKQGGPRSVSYRLVQPHEDGKIEQIERIDQWSSGELKGRIAAGDLCLAALCDGKVLGFQLVTFGEVLIPQVNLRRFFRPEEAWSETITIREDFRKRGLASEMPQQVFEELRQRGVTRLYGGSPLSHPAAGKLARRAGFREIADIRYTRLLGLEFWRCRKIPRAMPGERTIENSPREALARS